MNRLILIGNGFDLAHGLKTSYNDFILDYLKESLVQSYRSEYDAQKPNYANSSYEDELIIIKINKLDVEYDYRDRSVIIEKIILDLHESSSIQILLNKSEKYNITIQYKGSGFAESLIKTLTDKNWADIENLYYEELKKHFKIYTKYKTGENKDSQCLDKIKYLNQQLDCIKHHLQKHLIEVQKSNPVKIAALKDIIHYYLQPFYRDHSSIKTEGNYLFLNFNYTNTPVKYLYENDKIINIHGELENIKNPLIFGYGDEVDVSYQEIQELNENEFFKHIKSFDYFKTSNYTSLLTFINGGDFEVYVMGHSCGLSDRTMLSTIFENKNCKKIKIFDYREDKYDYRNKTYEISRHFRNKAIMRDKILPFNEDSFMPQISMKN
ncbi:MAG: hypothetical protein JWN78_1260 [Bacteroidota bacterium]|nr:hypothetical protein [Bacteroidota bacterium]